jgi:uncharacterized protein (UPF0276 family)
VEGTHGEAAAAGETDDQGDGGAGAEVINPVWARLDEACAHFGVVPTLLERDFYIPPLAGLLQETQTIRHYQRNWSRDDVRNAVVR